MARVKTFTNGGSLLPGDLNAMEDDYEFAFSTYTDVLSRMGATGVAPAAGTYAIPVSTNAVVIAGSSAALFPFYIDPADYTANTRVNKYRVRAQLITNAVAPATNWTFGLYPVLTWGGTSGNNASIATVGAVVAGSTVAFNAPALTTASQGNSGDFTAPAAGYYALAVVNSGASAAGSTVDVHATLQCRQV